MGGEGEGRARAPTPDLMLLRRDWLLWGLVGAVVICPVLAVGLMAAREPAAGLALVLAYMLGVAGVAVVGRGRASRQEAVLWALAIAVERGMPPVSALEAVAGSQGGRARRRLRALAGLLESGAPLPEALELVPGVLPRDAEVLVGAGWRSGCLAGALREAAEGRAARRPSRDAALPRLAYLLFVLVFLKLIVGFLFYFIVPKFEAIFKDFGLPLPQLTIAAIRAIRWASPILLLMGLLEMLALVALPFTFGGWPEGGLPLLDRLLAGQHSALVLRALAWVVEGGQPLPRGVAALARHHPSGWVRGRLEAVLRDLDDGADCWRALRDRGLIGPADAALLEAAGRAGNLPWALRQAAEGRQRRSELRWQVGLQALSALVVVGLGLLVLVLVTAVFTPLIALIQRLVG